MRYSEAMRLGAMASGQAFYKLCDEAGNTCAQGAVLLARGITDFREGRAWMRPDIQDFVQFLKTDAICPVRSERNYVCNIIAFLNNDQRWSRERIADWVATIEPREEPRPETVQVEPSLATDLAQVR